MAESVPEDVSREVVGCSSFQWMPGMLAIDGGRRLWRLSSHNGRLLGVPEAHDGLAYAMEWTAGATIDGAGYAHGSDWLPAAPVPEGVFAARVRGWSLVLGDPGSIGCLLILLKRALGPGAAVVYHQDGDAVPDPVNAPLHPTQPLGVNLAAALVSVGAHP